MELKAYTLKNGEEIKKVENYKTLNIISLNQRVIWKSGLVKHGECLTVWMRYGNEIFCEKLK
uniref:Uncharacterized protein n=1 Tax=Octopus bimaculoides TaxID=37653 RepID=A0A0L8GWZ0_OCTBM